MKAKPCPIWYKKHWAAELGQAERVSVLQGFCMFAVLNDCDLRSSLAKDRHVFISLYIVRHMKGLHCQLKTVAWYVYYEGTFW